eukprot:TRINITY_DN3563_c0_g4_i1.p1 TRINITY_DN3563_c0_g4~~TRINITY_DN3563_c0_g4_i1.p1  ORF type:complete len:229 (-),score=22.61 TRINITY_DN3563_c0_g4_i1:221-823(-)
MAEIYRPLQPLTSINESRAAANNVTQAGATGSNSPKSPLANRGTPSSVQVHALPNRETTSLDSESSARSTCCGRLLWEGFEVTSIRARLAGILDCSLHWNFRTKSCCDYHAIQEELVSMAKSMKRVKCMSFQSLQAGFSQCGKCGQLHDCPAEAMFCDACERLSKPGDPKDGRLQRIVFSLWPDIAPHTYGMVSHHRLQL